MEATWTTRAPALTLLEQCPSNPGNHPRIQLLAPAFNGACHANPGSFSAFRQQHQPWQTTPAPNPLVHHARHRLHPISNYPSVGLANIAATNSRIPPTSGAPIQALEPWVKRKHSALPNLLLPCIHYSMASTTSTNNFRRSFGSHF